MESIRLNNGVEMPMVGLGTWNLQGEECSDMVSKAISLGYRLIDTAQMYANEEDVGKGIIKSGISRDKLFITTKIYRDSNSYEKTCTAINRSLRSIHIEYMDLLLLHEPYQEDGEMYKAMEEALREGKTRAIGISNYDEKRYKEFLNNCDVIPAVNQVETHVLFQRFALQEQLKIGTTIMQAWAPLAQGHRNIPEIRLLSEIGNAHQKSAAQIALRFLVQRGIPVIPKSSHETRLIENIDLFDFSLTDNEMLRIKTLDRNKTLFSWTEDY